MMMSPMEHTDFEPRVDKPWGWELWWTVTDRYVGKVIFIEAGQRLSLQYHNVKDESIFVMDGHMILHLENADGELEPIELGPGQFCRVPVGKRHRFEAVADTRLLEVSTPELDDVVRLEDDFGREGTSAP
jgi:mannose-6-phosphate isomerase-like protein (cupin superfamily)